MNDKSNSTTSTDLTEFFEELGAGVFAQKVGRALSDVALGVVTYGDKGKTGEVTLTFTLKRIGESNQVTLDHKLTLSQPTMRGKKSEQDTTQTPMHVGRGGKLSLIPDNQIGMEFSSPGDRDLSRRSE